MVLAVVSLPLVAVLVPVVLAVSAQGFSLEFVHASRHLRKHDDFVSGHTARRIVGSVTQESLRRSNRSERSARRSGDGKARCCRSRPPCEKELQNKLLDREDGLLQGVRSIARRQWSGVRDFSIARLSKEVCRLIDIVP